MEKKSLSIRQEQVMEVLWNHPDGIVASEIVKCNDELQINTVQAALKSLVKMNYIKVGEIVYSGTVLTRSYVALISKDEYLQNRCKHLAAISSGKKIYQALLNKIEDTAELAELENIVKLRKKEV